MNKPVFSGLPGMGGQPAEQVIQLKSRRAEKPSQKRKRERTPRSSSPDSEYASDPSEEKPKRSKSKLESRMMYRAFRGKTTTLEE
jgi:hypothetical protein